ncbi:hypothetical protein MMC13_001019 [Lambiella insularis]|nr:hypothetical protein [Lambiella insularis]
MSMSFPVTAFVAVIALFVITEALVVRDVNSSIFGNTHGFTNSKITQSAGGNAICLEGTVSVTTAAYSTNILYTGPFDNQAATELFVELAQVNSDTVNKTNGGSTTVTGTYNIFSRLCMPADATLAANVETVQFLSHGSTADHTYWDLAQGYSYVDTAAAAGYATFSYDRLGTGQSDHPDPIQTVQVELQARIAHTLLLYLRTPQVIGFIFKHYVGVGHAFGSGLTQGVTAQYPTDFNAVILTGTSTNFTSWTTGLVSMALQIANTEPSKRFADLANGYLSTAPVPQAFQFAYYRYPYFDQSIFNAQFATRETVSLGEILTLTDVYVPSANFTGPVDVVLGQNDFLFCGGDCTYPTDFSALVQPALYPSALGVSQHFLVPNCGHAINTHLAAPQAFAQMLAFLAANGY